MRKQAVLLIVMFAFVVGISVGAVGVWAQDEGTNRIPPLPAGEPYQPNADELNTANVYQSVVPSVVNVSVVVAGGAGVGNGSGFVIDTQGHIVTNNHVVENASYIEVAFVDGSVAEATLIGRDPDADLAVIQIDPAEVAVLQPVTFADSSQVFIGQQVMAIGSPFGENQAFTMTTGVVSALNRDLPNPDQFSLPELIQTDAAINPGNSGGPLLDMAGNVIGVNTAILGGTRTASGVGFAIPSNTVRRIVPYLMERGEYQHSWLGISGTTLTPAQREAMNIPGDVRGVMIIEVALGGAAEEAELMGATQTIETPFGQLPVGGDIIIAVNGEPIHRMSDLIVFLESHTLPGDTITLTLWRHGETVEIPVTLKARPTVAF